MHGASEQRRSPRAWAIALAAAALLGVAPAVSPAAEFVVNSTVDAADVATGDGICDADPGAAVECTLRAALQQASAVADADTITVPAGTYTVGTPLAYGGGSPGSVTVVGAGAGQTVLDGGDTSGVLVSTAPPAAVVTLQRVTVQRGRASDGAGIVSGGALVLTEAVVSGNTATTAGGASAVSILAAGVAGTALLREVTIVGNTGGAAPLVTSSAGSGSVAVTLDRATFSANAGDTGALDVRSTGGSSVLRATNVTISGNDTDDSAGAAALRVAGSGGGSSAAFLRHVTIAGNTRSGTGTGDGIRTSGDGTLSIGSSVVGGNAGLACSMLAVVTSLDRNVVGDGSCNLAATNDLPPVADLKLGPLADNGGPTRTRALLAGSPAIGAAGATCLDAFGDPLALDQRSIQRPLGSACDAGAFEAQPDLRVSLVASPDPVGAGSNLTYAITVSNVGVSAAGAVQLADPLPDGVALAGLFASQGACQSGVTCSLGSIPAGGQASVSIVVQPTRVGTLVNTASVTTTGELAPADNVATASTTVASVQPPPPPGPTLPPPPRPRPPIPPDRCTIRGGPTADTLRGTQKADVICGLGGSDILIGLSGDDELVGGPGRDRLIGGAGKDRLVGGAGNDVLLGGPGDDLLSGGSGRDELAGAAGRDRLVGGPGKDVATVGRGDSVSGVETRR